MNKELTTTLIEVGKTAAGVAIARTVVVMGEKALKVNEEIDPKKKKFKQIGIGASVAAVGVIGATKVPREYKSIMGGIAVGGALSAVSPFGESNKGFIPVLNGTDDEDYIDLDTEINALSQTDDLDDYLDDELEEEEQINALASTYTDDSEDVQDVDFSEIN